MRIPYQKMFPATNSIKRCTYRMHLLQYRRDHHNILLRFDKQYIPSSYTY